MSVMKEQLTVVTRKGQVTIPASIRRALNLVEGDTVAWVLEDDLVRLERRHSVVAHTAGMLQGHAPPQPVEEERAAAEHALAEEVAERSNR